MNGKRPSLIWPLLSIAVIVRACWFPAESWDDKYRRASPEQRLVMDQQVLAKVQQYNVDHGWPADSGTDVTEIRGRIDADRASITKDDQRGKAD